ncbi:MAG TPA: glycosyltransferase [Verrucomicrobiae bacterium]|nr:glycosyltransferase [Verrucomicrobiae bacterium]
MKISGFTFIRNGLVLGYPFVPAIRSILPLCDEVIVNVPRSTDGTLDAVRQIDDPKIRILESEWDESQRTAGLAMSHHTNLALRECTGDWCVYIQGDEVLHEDTLPLMRAAMQREVNHPAVQGLLVDYTHFYGSYWTYAYSFGWYQREVRVVRRDSKIQSRGDAQGFRTVDNEKLWVKRSGGKYFHYGHALSPEQAKIKRENFLKLSRDDETVSQEIKNRPEQFYDEDQKVKKFTGTHPAVMRDIVSAANWTYTSRAPLIRFGRAYRRSYFWEDVAMIVKRLTGLTIGVHRNYRELRG